MKVGVVTLGLILASVALNASAQILLRLGARSGIAIEDRTLVSLVFDVLTRPAIVGGLAAYAISVAAWIYVLSRTEASFAYPFLGLGFVIVACAGWLLLGEVLSVRRIMATALIVAGVALIAGS